MTPLKTVLCLAIQVSVIAFLNGQEAVKTFPINNLTTFTLDVDYTNVTLRTHDDDVVKVEASAFYNFMPIEDEFEFIYEEANQKLILSIPFDAMKSKNYEQSMKDYISELDCDSATVAKLTRLLESGHHNQFNQHFESSAVIFLPSGLRNIVVNSTYGKVHFDQIQPLALHIDNVYGEITGELPIQIEDAQLNSVYGVVDVAIHDQMSTNIALESHYGEIFSNIEINMNTQKSIDKQFKSRIVGVINSENNNGVSLKSQYANVYLRKKS